MYYKLRQIVNFIFAFWSTYFNRFKFSLIGVKYGKKLIVTANVKIIKHPSGILFIGNNARFNSGYRTNPFGGENKMFIRVARNASLLIEDNVGISNSSIHCFNNIIIKKNVFVGGGVKIFDTDFHSLDYSDRMSRPDINIKSKPIIICEGAFIGGYSIVTKGVRIGKNAVIAAGSVVTKDVPDNEVWGGNPARFLKTLSVNLDNERI